MIQQLGKQVGLTKAGMRMVLLLVFCLLATRFVAAQSPDEEPPLALAAQTTVEVAVAGDKLTYFLTLTNTGPVPLEEVVVSDETPAGTTLFGINSPAGWMMTSPGQGRPGQVTWQLVEPLPPDTTATLEFIVTINLDATGPIINDTYVAQVPGRQAITGPPVITNLVLPTPTWTPPVAPPETPTENPTRAPTKKAPATPAATATSLPDVILEQAPAPTSTSAPTPGSPLPNSSGEGVGIMVLGGLALVILALGLVLLISRRARK